MRLNRYTHAPALHPNPLLAALQLLAWLLWHPSAWCNHIKDVAPDLPADFTLLDLTATHWRKPAVRRLFWLIYGLWPVAVGLLTVVILELVGRPRDLVLLSGAFSFTLGLIGGLVSGLTLSVAAGLIGVAVAGLSVGVSLGLAGMALYLGARLFLIGAQQLEDTLLTGTLSFICIGMTGGMAATISTLQPGWLGQPTLLQPWQRRLGSIAVGIGVAAAEVLIAIAAARYLAFNLTGTHLFGLAYGLLEGIALGVVFGVTLSLRPRPRWSRLLLVPLIVLLISVLRSSLDLSVAGRVDNQMAQSLIRGVSIGGHFSAFFGIIIALPYVLVSRTAGPWAGAIAGSLGGAGAYVTYSLFWGNQPLVPILPAVLLCVAIGLSISFWLPVATYPLLAAWGAFCWWRDRQQPAGALHFHQHPAFWDEHQRLPWPNLAEYLVWAVGQKPEEGQAALAFLSQTPQRWAAQAAQVELDAQLLEQGATVAALSAVARQLAAGELAGPASSLLRSFSRLSADMGAALAQEGIYNQRLALIMVEERLDGLLRELIRSDEPYGVRFQPIATRWRQIVGDHVRALAAAAELRQEIESPYVIGIPLTAQQEIFVGRAEISARIEQLLLDRRHPPLLLYGQRRMGKTSLLNNLGRMLPSTIVPFFVDLQGPASLASDYAGLLYNMARGMSESARRQRDLALPPLTRAELAADPFTGFDEWLDQVETTLGERTALLMLDEFEVLESAIASGRFQEEVVLGALRHWIQHRPRFKVLLTGSHVIDELKHWSNYLINVQVLHLGALSAAEVQQLVERPVPDFALRYESAASQRVFTLTRGHPALTQLLCYEIVALKNQQDPTVRRLATVADVEAAAPLALEHGSMFFSEIENGQLDQAGVDLLRWLATQGEGAAVTRPRMVEQFGQVGEVALELLLRRELLEPSADGYRVTVELIRRWFVGGG